MIARNAWLELPFCSEIKQIVRFLRILGAYKPLIVAPILETRQALRAKAIQDAEKENWSPKEGRKAKSEAKNYPGWWQLVSHGKTL